MAFGKILTQNRDLQLIQDLVDRAITPIQNSPFVNGVLLSNISLSSGNNTIPHSLGHVPANVWTSLPSTSATFFLVSSSASNIVVNASAGCKASFWLK